MYFALIAALTAINLQPYKKLLQLYVLCLLHPSRGAEYCDQPVCLCVYVCLSVCEHISGTAGPIGTKFLCAYPLWQWLGCPPAALCYIMYFWFYG